MASERARRAAEDWLNDLGYPLQMADIPELRTWLANHLIAFEAEVVERTIDRCLNALHQELSYPTEACAIIRAIRKDNP